MRVGVRIGDGGGVGVRVREAQVGLVVVHVVNEDHGLLEGCITSRGAWGGCGGGGRRWLELVSGEVDETLGEGSAALLPLPIAALA